jgi:hypothetical protein
VSLRNVAATVADFVSTETRLPFPGRSLIKVWRESSPTLASSGAQATVLSELPSPNPTDPNSGRSPAYGGPLVSLAQDDFVYIRNERDGSEALFNARQDPHERENLAGNEPMGPVLRRFRDQLGEVKGYSRGDRVPPGTEW